VLFVSIPTNHNHLLLDCCFLKDALFSWTQVKADIIVAELNLQRSIFIDVDTHRRQTQDWCVESEGTIDENKEE